MSEEGRARQGETTFYFEEIPAVEEQEEVAVDDGQHRPSSRVDVSQVDVEHEHGMMKELKFTVHEVADGMSKENENKNGAVPVECIVWTPEKGVKPQARGGCTLTEVGDDIILFGGATRNGVHFDDLWCLKGENKSEFCWEKIDAFGKGPSPRSGHSATSLGKERMVFFGGLNSSEKQIFNDVHVLCKVNACWIWTDCELIGTPPQPRTEHCCVAIDASNVLIFGGSSPTTGLLRDVHLLQFYPNSKEIGKTQGVWMTLRCQGFSPAGRELAGCCIIRIGSKNANQSADNNFERKDLHYGANAFLCYDRETQRKTFPNATNECSSNDIAKQLADQNREEGNAMFLAKDYRKALALYSEGLNHKPLDHLLYGNRSACYLLLNEAEKALDDALQAIRISPNWAKGYLREAQALVALNRPVEAQSAITAALELATNTGERENLHKLASRMILAAEDEPIAPPLTKGDYFCVYGGRGETSVLQDVCFLDLQTMTWVETIESPFPRCGHRMLSASFGDSFFAFGGWNGAAEVFQSGILFDADSICWNDCPISNESQDPPPRFSHGLCRKGDSTLLCFGGVSFEKDHDDLLQLALKYRNED